MRHTTSNPSTPVTNAVMKSYYGHNNVSEYYGPINTILGNQSPRYRYEEKDYLKKEVKEERPRDQTHQEEELCRPNFFSEEDDEEEDSNKEDSNSDYCYNKQHNCKICTNPFTSDTKLRIHMANIHARQEIKGKSSNFYSLVGYSIIGINSYLNYRYEEKVDRLTDLIDALQVNVNRMKRLSTIPESSIE
jgi:hypothetical protein